MSVSVRRVRVVVAGVVVAAALAACSGDPEPGPTADEATAEPSPTVVVEPEETPTPETTSAAPPVRTERPALMDEESDAGAIAAAEYFAVLAYETLLTNDLETWNRLYTDSCGFCEAVTEFTEEAISLGQTYEGGIVTVRGEPRIVGRDDVLGLVGVDVPTSVTAQVLRDSEGEVVDQWPDADEYFYAEMAFGYGGWQMVGAGTFAWSH